MDPLVDICGLDQRAEDEMVLYALRFANLGCDNKSAVNEYGKPYDTKYNTVLIRTAGYLSFLHNFYEGDCDPELYYDLFRTHGEDIRSALFQRDMFLFYIVLFNLFPHDERLVALYLEHTIDLFIRGLVLFLERHTTVAEEKKQQAIAFLRSREFRYQTRLALITSCADLVKDTRFSFIEMQDFINAIYEKIENAPRDKELCPTLRVRSGRGGAFF